MALMVAVMPVVVSAGETEAKAPVEQQCLWEWFAAGSVGYLEGAETEMYNLQIGREYVCSNGMDVRVYGEIGYANPEPSRTVDALPLSLNVEVENKLVGSLNWYAAAGVGSTYIDTNIEVLPTTWVFSAQLKAGLSYDVSDTTSVFGGTRWIYTDVDNAENSDAWLFEVGCRFKF